jgi:hypothetical protein
MNQSVMIPVSISAMAVSLGYVQVSGLWKDPPSVAPHWGNPRTPRPPIWMTQVAPVPVWKEEN